MLKPAAVYAASLLSGLFIGTPAFGADDAAFFKGREIKLVVGTGAGGGYDTYARLVSRFLGNHIPGQPVFIVQTMPGASGAKAVNWLYSAAPKDGTVIATFNNAMPFYQAIGQPGIRFKTEELSWIGSLSQVVNSIVVWHTTGVRTIEDAKHKEIVMGASGTGGTMASYPALLNGTLGTRFKIVTGYEAGAQVDLALERGEVQGRGSNPWTSWKAVHPEWVRDGKIVPLVQVGLKKDPDLQNVPRLVDLAQNEEQRRMFEFVSANISMERPYAGPPAMSTERLAAYRRAFDAMLRDEGFIAAAKQQNMDIDPLPGEKVQALVKSIVGTPPEIIEKVKAAITVKEGGK